ncbi:hypothetical protein BJ508DRAFT_420049 [Ascobolus immersus RN42]|uniref:F-box domain-containing protein n=1 Tax=Ascobolus immersus RN42 TaxID=1160509 RepID=A0A3N4HFY4_ASCIM|nr:hypothetical protein BJ508DRAFT_420049 [Ascobolus immersus RN42]
MNSLPPEILHLLLSSTSTLPDLFSLARTTPSLLHTYHDRRQTLLTTIATRQFHPTVLDILDHLRPSSSRREECSFHFWQKWTHSNVRNDRLAQTIPMGTQADFSSTPGRIGTAEVRWMLKFDRQLDDLIEAFSRRAEYGLLGGDDAEEMGWNAPNYLQSEIIHLAMMDSAQTSCLLDIFRLGKEGRQRLRTGLILMLSISRHLFSAPTIIHSMMQNGIDPLGLDDGIDGVRRYWLDANFLFNLSLEDHIYLISTCFHLRKAFNPCWLGDLLYWEIEGALVYLHLLERFDFSMAASTMDLDSTTVRLPQIKKRLIKGVLAYVDSYGIFNAFQSQIERLKDYLVDFTPACGYNKAHFLELDVVLKDGTSKRILILKKQALPTGDSSDDYIPKLKNRLLAVDDGGEPNKYFFEEDTGGLGGFV